MDEGKVLARELVDRIRTELFPNLAHYRQHCISERDDAETVASFISALLPARSEQGENVEASLQALADARIETDFGDILQRLLIEANDDDLRALRSALSAAPSEKVEPSEEMIRAVAQEIWNIDEDGPVPASLLDPVEIDGRSGWSGLRIGARNACRAAISSMGGLANDPK